jgi:hypothetical protein
MTLLYKSKTENPGLQSLLQSTTIVSCHLPRDMCMFACRPVPGFGIGCEDDGAMVLELDRTDAGIL